MDKHKQQTVNRQGYGFPIDLDRGDRHFSKNSKPTTKQFLNRVARKKLKKQLQEEIKNG